MKIAVVDDIASERHEIIGIFKDYFSVRFHQFNITPIFSEFDSGEDFLNQFSPRDYDLVLLDIYMSKLTGIETAEKLFLLDRKCKIIFLTSSTDHILDGYGVHAISYVLKPINEHCKSFFRALDYFIDVMNIDKTGINVRTEVGDQFILHKDIVYVENSIRNLYFNLSYEVIQANGKYSDYAEELLEDERFLECYRNLTVNMDYIDKPLESAFSLTTGDIVPISRRRKAEVLEKYTNYFIKRRSY